jgi:RNA polymerase-binding transcription factor DksA
VRQAELRRYRSRLLALSGRLRAEIEELDRAIAVEGHDPGDLSHLPTHSADLDTEELGPEQAMERNQVALLNATEAALERIETGGYGRCAGCGARIPDARLEAIPYAEYCIDCERAKEGRIA